MKIQVQSKLPHAVQTELTGGGCQGCPQYSDFGKTIKKKFGIINKIGGLLSQTSDPTSSSAQELDRPNAQQAQTVQPRVHKHLPCASKKKMRKTG
jgi:hypothetical protein